MPEKESFLEKETSDKGKVLSSFEFQISRSFVLGNEVGWARDNAIVVRKSTAECWESSVIVKLSLVCRRLGEYKIAVVGPASCV